MLHHHQHLQQHGLNKHLLLESAPNIYIREPFRSNRGEKMKSFIVGTAVFLIMIFFVLQWSIEQQGHYKRTALINIVTQHAQQARMEGYFTEDIKTSMREKISDKLHIQQDEIVMEVTDTPKYRTEVFNENEMISYKVSVPMGQIVAMAGLWGLDEDSNSYWYPIEGKVSSERLIDP